MGFRFSLLRLLVGMAVCAASFACFHSIPNIGVVIGGTVGAAFFALALIVKRTDASMIFRSYAYAAVGVVIAGIGHPGLNSSSGDLIAFALMGAIGGWLLGVVVNQSRRSASPDDRGSVDPDDTQYYV